MIDPQDVGNKPGVSSMQGERVENTCRKPATTFLEMVVTMFLDGGGIAGVPIPVSMVPTQTRLSLFGDPTLLCVWRVTPGCQACTQPSERSLGHFEYLFCFCFGSIPSSAQD